MSRRPRRKHSAAFKAIKRQLLWPVSDSYFGRSGNESTLLYSIVLDLPNLDEGLR